MVPVDAETGRHVVLGDAERIRAALQFAARVDALANPFADLEADLLGLAVQVVGAVAVKVAAFAEIVRIAAVPWRTDAGSVLTHRSRSTLHVAAAVYAFASDAGVIEGTGHCVTAGAGGWVRAGAHLYLLAADERIAEESVLATAVVAANCVDADGVAAASVSIALVDICRYAGFGECVGNEVNRS